MKTQTLLEKARASATASDRESYDSDEELDLMLALVTGEITMRQATVALGRKPGTGTMAISYRCFAVLRDGISAGKITIERTRNGK